MRPSQRERILEAPLRLLRADEGAAITLETAAREAGMTKAGLMYHFPTKLALMLAVVNHVGYRWERTMFEKLGTPLEDASPARRVRAYVDVACSGQPDRADYAIFSDAAYLPRLAHSWTRRFNRWFETPTDLPEADRTRLTLARLAADGCWTALATGMFAPPDTERASVIASIVGLTEPL